MTNGEWDEANSLIEMPDRDTGVTPAADHDGAASDFAHRKAFPLSIAVLDRLGDGFFALDTEFRFVWLNVGAEALFARSRSALIGRNIWEALPSIVDSGLYRACRTALAEGATASEDYIDPALGTRFEVIAFPQPAGLAALLRERPTRPASQRIFERAQFPAIAFIVGPDGRGPYISESFTELTGVSSRSELGFAAGVAPEDVEAFQAAWGAGLVGRAPFSVRVRLRSRAGGVRWFEVRVAPVLREDGTVVEWVGAALEIDELVRTSDGLSDSMRRKDDFLALLAHELRNPLAPIRAGIHILREAHATPSQIDRARDMLERQARQLARLVDDLLDISRIARGKILLKRSRIDLVDLVRTAANDHRAMLESAGLSLELALPERPVHVSGDVARLSQVFGNLLHNAVKFTDPGGTITVRVVVNRAANTVSASVEDTGIGMDPMVLSRVFQTFEQTSEASAPTRPVPSLTGLFDPVPERSRGGLGLGLALAHGLVALHGGRLRAESELGRGSQFTLDLPIERRAAPRVTPKATVDGDEFATGPRRILLVEDNVDSAESLSMLLELAGHRVQVAHTGLAGIEVARAFQPEIIFCDIGLPGISGYEVARVLRREPDLGWAHIIAMTGYGQEEDLRLSREAGFEMHLTKPVDPIVLKRLVAVLPRRAPGAGAK